MVPVGLVPIVERATQVATRVTTVYPPATAIGTWIGVPKTKGKRFFSENDAPRELTLVSTRTASSGVVMSTYRPVGPLRTGSFADATE